MCWEKQKEIDCLVLTNIELCPTHANRQDQATHTLSNVQRYANTLAPRIDGAHLLRTQRLDFWRFTRMSNCFGISVRELPGREPGLRMLGSEIESVSN